LWCLAASPGENNNKCSWYQKKDAVGNFIRKSDSIGAQGCVKRCELDTSFFGPLDPTYWSCPQREPGFGNDAYPPTSTKPIAINTE
jgi:hypothetical protein